MLVPEKLSHIKNITPEILGLYKQLMDLQFKEHILKGHGVITMAPYIKKGLENITDEEQNNVYYLRYKKKLITLEIDYFLDVNLNKLEKVDAAKEEIADYLIEQFSSEEQEKLSLEIVGVKYTKDELEDLVKKTLSDKILSDMVEGLMEKDTKEDEEEIDNDEASILMS